MPSNVVGFTQSHPPGCQCGCGGNWGCDSPGWGQDLMQCWDQINQLKCIIKQIIDEVGGPVRTGPIKGVIDGSDAKPGEVGEFLTQTIVTNWSLAAGVVQAQTIPALVINPGDWDVMVQVGINFVFNSAYFQSDPNPTGMNPPLFASAQVDVTAAGEGEAYATLTSSLSRLSTSVPTLVPVTVHIVATAASSGTTDTIITARRRR